MAAFQVVDEILEWNTSAPEAGGSAHNLSIDYYDRLVHNSLLFYRVQELRAA